MEGTTTIAEEAQARSALCKYVLGYIELSAVKCAVELQIPDIIESRSPAAGNPITLADLSSAVGCSPPFLRRIMRLLTHHGIFNEVKSENPNSPISYTQTALSRLLTKDNMAPMVLLSGSPAMVDAKLSLSKAAVADCDKNAFEVTHGVNLWKYAAENASHSKLFDDAMACQARFTVSTVVERCATAFEGIRSLVDVGGGNGTALRTLASAFPWIIRAVNFDLPHVVSSFVDDQNVAHIGGDMFHSIPKADAAFLMWVLHDWDDEACIKILKNCKEAIPENIGKLIIVETVIDDEDGKKEDNEYKGFQLAMDVGMMIHTIKGKERTSKEWSDIITMAGFSKHTIKYIPATHSVIVAYP